MLSDARRQAYAREQWKEIYAQALGWDDPYRYGDPEADLEAMADRAMAAEARGEQVTQTWLVIPFYTPGVWGHRAVEPDGLMHGCLHMGSGVNLVQSQVAAVHEHQVGTSCREVR